MTKAELVNEVVKQSGDLSKTSVQAVIDATFSIIAETLKNEAKFAYPGFGTFVVRTRKARVGRNPRTGEQVAIEASKTVGFKPATQLKNSL
jgi:DNA-binding protein HU-beta